MHSANNNVDKTIWYRHEFKYLISEAQVTAIEEYIRPYTRPDPYCVDGAYPLVSLYLDSDDLLLCRESLEGVKNRFKLRIRSYNDAPDETRFFEVKRRINRIIVKTRARVADREVATLLTGMKRPFHNCAEDVNNLEQFLYYRQKINAKPILRVRYFRQAYEGILGEHLRVTFDRKLCFNMTCFPSVQLNGDGWRRLSGYGVVLEIKFTGPCPVWLSRMIQCFGLQYRSFSKYAVTVKRVCGLRFYAPTILKRRNSDGTIMANF